jgi:hypothetical protein
MLQSLAGLLKGPKTNVRPHAMGRKSIDQN